MNLKQQIVLLLFFSSVAIAQIQTKAYIGAGIGITSNMGYKDPDTFVMAGLDSKHPLGLLRLNFLFSPTNKIAYGDVSRINGEALYYFRIKNDFMLGGGANTGSIIFHDLRTSRYRVEPRLGFVFGNDNLRCFVNVQILSTDPLYSVRGLIMNTEWNFKKSWRLGFTSSIEYIRSKVMPGVIDGWGNRANISILYVF